MTSRSNSNVRPIRPRARPVRSPVRQEQPSIKGWLVTAAFGGLVLGAGSIAATPEGRAALVAQVKPIAVPLGIMRARAPQEGDYWHGCDSARAAGTAPIYRGEPGYRTKMDGDNDGIACEPYR